ncbi:MAG: efflux RND transporter periplasmic adaptor subunit [Ignavibacterium sp.]|jgi:membrane fusion protein (multidrug efflux system)|nr:efflux RND transporter periplasmic adaptor subunit [Ignavibacterium sp.]
MKNNIKKIIITAVILVLLLIILLPKLLSSSSKENNNLAGNKTEDPVSVKAYIVVPQIMNNNVLTTGTILANEEVELKSEVAGKITKILFNEGSYVDKGDLLVKINDADLQAQLRRAESKVKLAEEKEFRQRQLRDGNLISQEEYDNTLGELNVNKADYDLIKAQIDKTEIRAPFSGTIGLRSVSEGSYLTTSTIIATFQNLNIIKIDFSIPEKYSTSVKKGDELDFKISGSATVFKAKIYAIEPKIDPGTRTLKIRAICNSNYSELIPGAFANVELSLKKINDAILVPSVAIVPELKGQKVYLYKNGVVAQQNVDIGIREETSIQVVSGLNAGDTVITSGILQIKPMSKVTISEFVK